MKRSNITPANAKNEEDAMSIFRALSYIYRSEYIYIEDKKDLMYQFVRYIINRRISLLPSKMAISLRNQASLDAYTSQQHIVRYYETHYGHHCAQMLDHLFGRGCWQHVVQQKEQL